MPRISAFYGVVIYMYWNGRDHPVAHFHAYHAGRRASVSADGNVLAGSLEPRADGPQNPSLRHCDFSSTHTTTAFSGGCRYRPTTSVIFASRCGSVENLNPSVRCGCRQNRRHRRAIESWLTDIFLFRRSQSARRRLDQCVTPIAGSEPGGGVTVADRISAIAAGQHGLRAAGARRVPQPGQAVLGVRPPPFDHRRLGAADPLRDLRAGQTPGGQQHDPRPLRHPGRPAPVPGHRSSVTRSPSGTARMRTRFGMSHCPAPSNEN
jgi:Domain of unknown function (DUF4160)